MNKYIDGAIILTSICTLGLTTVSIAESKIHQASSNITKDFQLERLNNSLTIELNNSETTTASLPVAPQPKPVRDLVINLIKEFEGFKGYAYIDTDGTPVIGYGLSMISGKAVQLGDRISPSQANVALNAHVQEIQQELEQTVQVEMSDSQLSALASISFNVGINSIKNSTLIRKLNAKDYAGAANEFLRWDKANQRGRLIQMPGLTRRRQAERKLFLEQSS